MLRQRFELDGVVLLPQWVDQDTMRSPETLVPFIQPMAEALVQRSVRVTAQATWTREHVVVQVLMHGTAQLIVERKGVLELKAGDAVLHQGHLWFTWSRSDHIFQVAFETDPPRSNL